MIALWMMYATIVTVLLGAGAAMLERGTAGRVQQRRWVWMAALTMAVVIPAWAVVVPGSQSGLAPTVASGQGAPPASPNGIADGVASRISALIAAARPAALGRLDETLAILWAAAASLAFAAYGGAVWSLARRRRTWRAAIVDGHEVLLARAVGPAVVGALRPQIVVPEWSLELTAEHRALMLEHERQHVLARDPLMLHVAAMCALVMPWNVGAWWLNRRLRLAVELDCDARVLSSGRDARTYGTLLLDVCSRRTATRAMLAPALLERTSSLAKRILAMQPHRGRFPRARGALGAAAACAVVALACEMPTPDMVAPDGQDVTATRLYGGMTARNEGPATEPREVVARYFPEIAQGRGGASILFVIKSATGTVVLTESQPAPVREEESRPGAHKPTTDGQLRVAEVPAAASSEVRLTPRRPGSEAHLPSAIRALRPDDIAAVDVSKHAAGSVAPNPVSIITIVLKAGVTVPQPESQR